MEAAPKQPIPLAEEHLLLRALIDLMPDIISIKDREGRNVWVSRTKLKELGLSDLKDAIGKTGFDFFDRATAERFKQDDDQVLQTGQPVINHREKIVKPDGQTHWHLTTKVPWRDTNGNVVGLMSISRDITERVQAEIELEAKHNLLRTLIDHLPDCIYAKDAQARKIMANPADLKNLGCKTEAEAIGKSDFDLFPKEIAEAFFMDDQAVLKGRPVINREEKVVLPNGETRWLLTSKIPWRTNGDIIGLVGIGRDISDRKKAEVKLQEERNLLRTLIDNLPDGVYAKDAEARKIIANPADLKNLGCKNEAEAVGKSDFDLYPKEVASAFFADDQAVLKDGKSVINREEKAVLPNGETRWLLTSKIPWRDANGKIIGLVGIGRDITDKKNLAEQVVNARRMESLGRLATGVAHDLNNILAPILISIELLRNKLQDEDYLKMLAKAEANAHRGADIIKQMLWFGRGMAGKREPVNLRRLAVEIARFTSENFDKSIKIETQIAPDLWTTTGDSMQLHQVLMNLCINARDAMPSGGTLTIAARNLPEDAVFSINPEAVPGPFVVFEIRDTGGGVAPELLDKIFEPFFTTKEVGHGLGLSTAQSIAKSHHGFIETESLPGCGATFRIFLPAEKIGATPGDALTGG
jgi:PAS domain S-box-containing protein